MPFKNDFVFPLEELGIVDADYVGVKSAALGEVIQFMKRRRIRVPAGFATTSEAYWAYLDANGMRARIWKKLDAYERGAVDLSTTGKRIRTLMLRGEVPEPVAEAVQQAYRRLGRAKPRSQEPDVAVRSSPTVEELPDVTAAAQQDSFLHVIGIDAVLRNMRRCFASLFSDRAIQFRESAGVDHMSVALSLCVQRMVRADLACAGMGFSDDRSARGAALVRVRATWGLGDRVVTGEAHPDIFRISKRALTNKKGVKSIVERELGAKARKHIYRDVPDSGTRRAHVTRDQQARYTLTDREVLTLARWICALEAHFGGPVTIEWAKDGLTDQLFLVQVQPGRVDPPEQSDGNAG